MLSILRHIMIPIILLPFHSFGQEYKNVKPGVLYVKIQPSSPKVNGAPGSPSQSFGLDAHFINKFAPVKRNNSNLRSTPSVLDGLYKIYFNENYDLDSLIEHLSSYQNVVYAAPVHEEKLLYTPNDPMVSGNQPYLNQIRALDAWSVTQGSEELVIGIIDTGLDLNHEDITNKVYINPNEIPNNGIDDDGNGYIDDYKGFDFADDDALAQADGNIHGNRVGGIAGAETDNGTGMAGVGFKTKISPLKIFRTSDGKSNNSYDAIIYAADHGYDVINLSWGSVDTYNQAYQDIINYVVLEKNVVVVAAAGNTPEDLKFYPASYNNVLSVAASNLSSDEKASFSTYNYSVDLMAPGNAILSTASNNNYGQDLGTSYSAPMVSGAAALVKSRYPNLNALQIMELLRVTTDDIYQIQANQSFTGMLGKGRLNIYEALTESNAKSMRVTDFNLFNDIGNYSFYGDTLYLSFETTSYLKNISNGSVHLSSASPYVQMVNADMALGAFDTLMSKRDTLIAITLTYDTPPDQPIAIRLDFEDDIYKDFQYLEFKTSPDYIELENETLKLPMSGNGNLGAFTFGSTNSSGLKWNDQVVSTDMGFFVAFDKNYVADNIPLNTENNDFQVEKNIKLNHAGQASLMTQNSFSDSSNLIVHQKSFINDNQNYFILEYRLINTSPDTIQQAASGLYINWELVSSDINKAMVHENSSSLIAYDNSNSLYAGIRAFNGPSPVMQAFDLADNNGNTSDIGNINDSILFKISTTHLYDSAGNEDAGNDIAHLISQDSITIPPAKSKKIAFLIALAPSLNDLLNELDAAASAYQSILENPDIQETVVSCEVSDVTINPVSGTSFEFYKDPLGNDYIGSGDSLFVDTIRGDTSFYLVNIDSAYEGDIKRLDIKLITEIADFEMDNDTIFLNDPGVSEVRFTDKSFRAITWNWDFSNGEQATVQNPLVHFNSTGNYTITLDVENDYGCTGSIQKDLLVANRPDVPVIANLTACPDEEIVLQASNTDSLQLYASQESSESVSSGTQFTVGPFIKDTSFFLTNVSGPFESLKAEVFIQITTPNSEFTYSPDTTSASTRVIFEALDKSNVSYDWSLDGLPSGTSDTLNIAVNKNNYNISLGTVSANGCSSLTAKSITFSTSPQPLLPTPKVCFGEDFLLKPENGNYFAFYKDSNQQELLKKGSQLLFKSIQDTTDLYLVGLDSILPSQPLHVQLKPELLDVTILAEPDTLILKEGLSAVFSLSHSYYNSIIWYRDSIPEASDSPLFFFDQPGNHPVSVRITSPSGCHFQDTLEYVVMENRPFVLGTDHIEDYVFPNPAIDRLIISPQVTKNLQHLTISNVSGRKIKTITNLDDHQNKILDLTSLPGGIYILTFHYPNHSSRLKLIKQ